MPEERFKLKAAVHLYLIKGDEILLHLRKNSSFEGLYGLPAGHLDGGETATNAMIREAKEEASISIKPQDLKMAGVCHSHDNGKEFIQFFFECKNWEGQITNTEPHKCEELKFFKLTSLPDNTVPYVKNAIQNYLDGNTYFESGWEA